MDRKDEKILCPYDNSHHIRRCKMAEHLVKCRKNKPRSHGLVTCDFNSTHRIPHSELQVHYEMCEDRKAIEPKIDGGAIDPNIYGGDSLKLYPVVHLNCPTTENWDDDSASSYDPTLYVESNDIIRERIVESKSVKKNFRQSERERHQGLDRPPSSTDLQEVSRFVDSHSPPSRTHPVEGNVGLPTQHKVDQSPKQKETAPIQDNEESGWQTQTRSKKGKRNQKKKGK